MLPWLSAPLSRMPCMSARTAELRNTPHAANVTLDVLARAARRAAMQDVCHGPEGMP